MQFQPYQESKKGLILLKLSIESVNQIAVFFKSITDEEIFKDLSSLQLSSIGFYCFEIEYDGKTAYLFRQFAKMKKLRSGYLAQSFNDELIAMDGNFLGIDETTDMVLFGDQLILFNHISLERIFNYRDQYLSKTNEAMGEILRQGILTNLEQFTEDCCRDVRIMKRFTNIMTQGRLPLFFENYEKVPEIVKELELDIEFDQEGKMVYREKSQLHNYCIGGMTMNAVGIDVSKGKSTIAVMRPGKETVIEPFEVSHTDSELIDLARVIQSLEGETRVVMEATGNYHLPVAWMLHDAGIYVSVVNAMLIRNYGNNTIRKGKTDKKDAQKIANYAIDNWTDLQQYFPEEDVRLMLKNCYRQYEHFSKIRTMMKNNLIALLDVTFPDANNLFSSPRKVDGSEKWLDFIETFWHCQCVCHISETAFLKKYQKWCKKHAYNFSKDKALDIYAAACGHVCVMPKTDAAEFMMKQAVTQLKTISKTLAALQQQMQDLAEKLPEYPVVMQMFGVGPVLGPQLMAEIGDVRRFHSKKALIAFAGIDAPPYQSGAIDDRSRSISKRGSSSLRRSIFLVMSVILKQKPLDEPVYQFMDKKRAAGKPYKVYMMASANKFLRVYYATVRNYLDSLEAE